MSIHEVFRSLTDFFERERLDYAVIGAFALYGYGYVRATRDIDFITRLFNQEKITRFLEGLGFETTNRSRSFSNHVHPIDATRVDVMYVEGSTADEILSSSAKRLVLKGLELPVVSPEHLIALKLFAAQNNPARKLRELSDVKEIVSRAKVDGASIRHYFIKYGHEGYYDEIVGSTEPQ